MPLSAHTAVTTLRVFVVEDHAETSKYMKMYLEMFGHPGAPPGACERAWGDLRAGAGPTATAGS